MGRSQRQSNRQRNRRREELRRSKPSQGSGISRWELLAAGALVVIVAAFIVALVSGGFGKSPATSSGATGPGPQGTQTAIATHTPVAGLSAGPVHCSYSEQVGPGFYHVHAHLDIFVDGKSVTVPSQIGFDYAHDCLYWTHTHYPSYGIIHIEAPYKIVPTLGDFFKVWGVPLTTSQVWKYKGPERVYLNGKVFKGNLATIKLHLHDQIALEIGKPWVKPAPFDFAKYGL